MRVGRIWTRGFAMASLLFGLLVAPSVVMAGDQPTVEELKARVANANLGDRPAICLHISERQLEATTKSYGAGETEKAQAELTDVTAFAELDRDYAIQSHKHEKQSEIAIRKMARKLDDLKHTVPRDDQAAIQQAIDRLQRVRDDLLTAMFPKGGKK